MSTTPQGDVPTFQPSNIDLIDLLTTKSWLGINATNTDDDNIIQFLITTFSQHVINKTGVASFSNVSSYTDTYDGNGQKRLFIRNPPIINVSSIIVGSLSLPQSTGLTSSGWFIEDSKKSIALRGHCYRFHNGIGNIQVTYNAGYSEVPEDLAEAAMCAVGQNYRRKDWVDLATQAISSGSGVSGTTKYHTWIYPPSVWETIMYYKRRALV
jgi:hypothetical protein